MTVSTINTGVSAELRRTQDLTKKQPLPLPLQPSGASLPDDLVSTPVANVNRPDLATAIRNTQQQNLDAAQSTLSDADLDQLFAERPVATAEVARDPKASIAAQTGNLPQKILDLLSE